MQPRSSVAMAVGSNETSNVLEAGETELVVTYAEGPSVETLGYDRDRPPEDLSFVAFARGPRGDEKSEASSYAQTPPSAAAAFFTIRVASP